MNRSEKSDEANGPEFSDSDERSAVGDADRTMQRVSRPPPTLTDRVFPIDASSIEPTSTQTQKFWGLLTSPFSPQFYFRTPSHVAFWNSAAAAVSGNVRLSVVRSEIGSGVSTLFEQIRQSAGINDQPIDTFVTDWTNQSIDKISEKAAGHFHANLCQTIGRLWLIRACRPTQVSILRAWLRRHGSDPDVLSPNPVCTIIRIEDNPMSTYTLKELPTLWLHRPDTDQRQRCVRAAIRHAGATRPILSDDATRFLCDSAAPTFTDLGNRLHATLTTAHLLGLKRLSLRDVQENTWAEIVGGRPKYRRAA